MLRGIQLPQCPMRSAAQLSKGFSLGTHARSASASTSPYPLSFHTEKGVSVDRTQSSPLSLPQHIQPKLKKYWKPKNWKPRGQNPLHALLRVERQGGARVVHINNSSTNNRLDAMTVEALSSLILSYEGNPAVTSIILTGATNKIFCSGTDLADLASRRGSSEVGRGYLKRQMALHHIISTCTKPVITGMDGLTLGSGYALAANSRYSYATAQSIVSVPEVTRGLLPHGGASYHLSRLEGGVGMYMALTGAVLKGQEVYWSGVAPLYGLSGWARTVATAAGESSSSATTAWDMDRDPQYAKSLGILRDFRAQLKMSHVSDNMNEDVSREIFDYYVRLKRWYGFIAAGDRISARETLLSSRVDEEGLVGDLFDFQQGSELDGRDTLPEPAFAAQDRRTAASAIAGYSEAVGQGELDGGPSPAFLRKLHVIQAAFAGKPTTNDPVLLTKPAPRKIVRTSEVVLKEAAARGFQLPQDWESGLGVTLHDCVMAVFERMETIPVDTEIPTYINAIRLGVVKSQGRGALAQVELEDLCFSMGVPDRQQARDIVSRGISYTCARVLGEHKRSDSNAWVLEDASIVARDTRVAEAAERAKYAGISLPADAGNAATAAASTSATNAGEVDVEGGPPGTPRLVNPGVEDVYYDPKDDDFWHQIEREPWEKPDYAPALEPAETQDTIALGPREDDLGVVTALDAANYSRFTVGQMLQQLPLDGLSLYKQALQHAVSNARVAARRKHGAAGARSDPQGKIPSPIVEQAPASEDQLSQLTAELEAATTKLREEYIRAMLATAGTAVAQRLELTEADIKAMAEIQLDESEAAPRNARELAEKWEDANAKKRVLAWNTLQKALVRREQISQSRQQPAAATSSTNGAPAPAASTSAPVSSTLVMPQDSVKSVEALIKDFAAAEVALIGSEAAAAVINALDTPEMDHRVRATDQYVVAKDAATGLITLARRDTLPADAPKASPLDTISAPPKLFGEGSTSRQQFDSLLGAGAGSKNVTGATGGAAAGFANSLNTGKVDEEVPAWEPHHARRALTEPEYLLRTFKLPNTPDTMAAAVRVVDHFQEEADGRAAVAQPKSVDVIVSRLKAIINNAEKRSDVAGRAALAEEQKFAAAALKQLTSLTPEAVRSVHALLVKASQSSLKDTMKMEYRGLTRLQSQGTAAASGKSVEEISDALFAPFAKEQRAQELHFARRKEVDGLAAERSAQLDEWLAKLPAAYESGLHSGVLGDVMRRRFAWFKAPYEAWDGGDSLDEDQFVDRVEKSYDDLTLDVERSAGVAGTSSAVAALRNTGKGRVVDMFDQLAEGSQYAQDAVSTHEWSLLKGATRADLARWTAELEADAEGAPMR